MTDTATGRILVKTRVRQPIHDALRAYAERTHRTISSAAEHLIALGLERESLFGQEAAR